MGFSIGIIGLGDMGCAISAVLKRQELPVRGFDVSCSRMRAFEALGGSACASASEVAASCDLIVTLLPSETALKSISVELGAVNGAGKYLAECSTLGIDAKIEAFKTVAKAGFSMLDAPISGTAEQTREMKSTVFLSGTQADVEAVCPAFMQFTARQLQVGPFGAGMAIKLVANHLIAVNTAAAAEAIRFGQAMGLDRAKVHNLISGGPASSGMFELRGARMVSGKYQPASGKLAVIAKDRKLIEAAAQRAGFPLSIFRTCFRAFDRAIEEDDQNDLASVIDHLVPEEPA